MPIQDPPKPIDAEAFIRRTGVIRVHNGQERTTHTANFTVEDVIRLLNQGVGGKTLVAVLHGE